MARPTSRSTLPRLCMTASMLMLLWIAGAVAQPSHTGTSTLVGRVVTADLGRPLRGAVVTLISVDGQLHGRVSTDAQGIFEMKGVPTGRFSLEASAPGFVNAVWGEAPEDGRFRPLIVAAGQFLDKLDLALRRGGVITGRLVDEVGEPVEGVPVHALVSEYTGGRARLMPVSHTARRTDDRGRYRLFGLTPGEYVILACPGAIGVTALEGSQLTGYVPTYYPGSAQARAAVTVGVRAAQEVDAGDLVLVASRTYQVSGTFVGANGSPTAGAEIVLVPELDASVGIAAHKPTTAGGLFTFENVPPGQYILQNLPARDAPTGFASMVLTVSGHKRDVVLQGRLGRVIHGEILLDDGTRPTFQARDLDIVHVAKDFTRSPVARGPRATVRDDWTFELRDVWGAYTIDVRAPTGWSVKTLQIGGHDVTDTPVDWERVALDDRLQIVLTRRITGIAGMATDDQGRPAAHYPVVLFASDAARWTSSRRVLHKTVTDEHGRFSMSSVPPGDYQLVALDRLPKGQWPRPAFVESLRGLATAVTLHEGEQRQMTLQVARLPGA